ncbi:MAG: YaaA family protein, partial [Clostridium sp.]|nr:YaaA family protein [Clostridium sp.]
MIAIISPAKNMRNLKIDNINPQIIGKERYFTKETDEIIRVLKDLTPWDIQSLMKVNEKIALQSYAYFQDFNFNDKGVCGLLAYDGLVFKNIKAEDFTKEDFDYANKHIRILDAFYGMVNP